MANSLTGDFDVVAEFAIGAANRVIAAMHRAERFLHSTSVRVEDTSRPGHRDPSIVASVAVESTRAIIASSAPTMPSTDALSSIR